MEIFLGLVVLVCMLLLIALARSHWQERKELRYDRMIKSAECRRYSHADVESTQHLYERYPDLFDPDWKPDNLEELFERQNPTPKRQPQVRSEDWDPRTPGAL